ERTVRIDLEIAAQRIERDRAVAGVLRCRRQLLEVRRVSRVDLHGRLVRLDGVRGSGYRLLVQGGYPGRSRRRGARVRRVLAYRRPKGAAGKERRTRIRGLRRLLCALILRRVLVRL